MPLLCSAPKNKGRGSHLVGTYPLYLPNEDFVAPCSPFFGFSTKPLTSCIVTINHLYSPRWCRSKHPKDIPFGAVKTSSFPIWLFCIARYLWVLVPLGTFGKKTRYIFKEPFHNPHNNHQLLKVHVRKVRSVKPQRSQKTKP